MRSRTIEQWIKDVDQCPCCCGTGVISKKACVWCEGSGDYLGSLLLACYQLGLERSHTGREMIRGIFTRVEEMVAGEKEDRSGLRLKMGLPPHKGGEVSSSETSVGDRP